VVPEDKLVRISASVFTCLARRVAGYFKLDRTHDAHMFYFYFQARRTPSKAPVVLWMTGG
jgi:carboxypeptidase C (cathepsin A)